MRLRQLVACCCALVALAVCAPASADEAQHFIERERIKLDHLLHDPASPARDSQINSSLDGFVDYAELTRRAFGEPCPAALPACEDLWAKYSESQRAEVKDLLSQLVRKSYRKNLMKTLDYDVSYRGTRDVGADTRVLTEAKNKDRPREPAVRVDYVVKQTSNGYRVVDIITEGSSLTKNYYEQFRKKMDNPGEGYSNIVQKLREKIARQD
ncbi:MAG: ABC transporter substrate-binding protein [Myxococcota bacterium]|nr:ABC transporter substrate-binding protein [Myxococcota bacterium]